MLVCLVGLTNETNVVIIIGFLVLKMVVYVKKYVSLWGYLMSVSTFDSLDTFGFSERKYLRSEGKCNAVEGNCSYPPDMGGK